MPSHARFLEAHGVLTIAHPPPPLACHLLCTAPPGRSTAAALFVLPPPTRPDQPLPLCCPCPCPGAGQHRAQPPGAAAGAGAACAGVPGWLLCRFAQDAGHLQRQPGGASRHPRSGEGQAQGDGDGDAAGCQQGHTCWVKGAEFVELALADTSAPLRPCCRCCTLATTSLPMSCAAKRRWGGARCWWCRSLTQSWRCWWGAR